MRVCILGLCLSVCIKKVVYVQAYVYVTHFCIRPSVITSSAKDGGDQEREEEEGKALKQRTGR